MSIIIYVNIFSPKGYPNTDRIELAAFEYLQLPLDITLYIKFEKYVYY